MKRHSQNTSGAVAEQPEQALTCAAREVIKRKCPALFVICVLSVLICGCSMVSGTRHTDGRLVVTSWRFLWKSEAVAFSIADTNGFTSALSIGKSRSDEESIKSAVDAAVTAALKGVAP